MSANTDYEAAKRHLDDNHREQPDPTCLWCEPIHVADVVSVAFMVSRDHPTDDPGGDTDKLAERVERVLRDLLPDLMIRRMDPVPSKWIAGTVPPGEPDAEVWL